MVMHSHTDWFPTNIILQKMMMERKSHARRNQNHRILYLGVLYYSTVFSEFTKISAVHNSCQHPPSVQKITTAPVISFLELQQLVYTPREAWQANS